MIMSGLEYTGQIPFEVVYLHGLVRDEQGQKMSKTKGNVIDPLIVMDDLGTDALRFTLLVGSTPGKDTNLSLKKVEANRNFANKVWNAARLVLSLLDQAPEKGADEVVDTLADRWISARLNHLVRDVERLFQNYQYGEAGRQVYEFFWSEFADWYLEIAKLQVAEGGGRSARTAGILTHTLDTCLRLLHPFTPFVTEELWGHLKAAAGAEDWGEALIMASWPVPQPEEDWEAQAVSGFSLVMDIVRAIRNLRAEKQVKPGHKIPAILACGNELKALGAQAPAIAALAGLDLARLEFTAEIGEKPEGHVALVVGAVQVFLPMADLVDTDEERARLQKDLADAENQISRLEKLLNSPFAQKAPPDVVEKERQKLAEYRESTEKIKAQLAELG